MIDSLASHLTLGFFGWAFGLWIAYVVVLRFLFVERATPFALVFYAGFMLALTFSRFSVMVAAVLVVNGLLLALSLGRRRVTLTLLAVNTGVYFIGMNTENFPQPAAIAGVVLSLAFGLLYWHAVTQGGGARPRAPPHSASRRQRQYGRRREYPRAHDAIHSRRYRRHGRNQEQAPEGGAGRDSSGPRGAAA